MKTVSDLIVALKDLPDWPVRVVYDGLDRELYVFQWKGKIYFSNEALAPETYDNVRSRFESGELND